MGTNGPAKRRKDDREMNVDRRKSASDVMEHVVLGVRAEPEPRDE
jgi:hypothetical protein